MQSINDKRYDNISEAVAFVIRFEYMIYSYGNVSWEEYEMEACSRCHRMIQHGDFLAPTANCKKPFGILDSYHFGVNEELRNDLIENFDIAAEDFRPVRNKTGQIVYYQITPQHTMQPIASVNRVKMLKPCRKCGHVQHRIKEYETEEGYAYYFITEEALKDLHDVNETVEKFNMYFPLYVVSRRVYDHLSAKYPRMRFEPMFLRR